MGLLGRFFGFHRRPRQARAGNASRRPTAGGLRLCRFEPMEPRQLLSAAPIQIGAVYYEDASGEDQDGGDRFEITFLGGAPGTQLTQLTIETEKLGDGLTIGDCLFDTAPGGMGAYLAAPLEIVSQEGIDSVGFSVADGSTTLVFTFAGFDPDDKLVFTVDVDEMGFLGPNAVAEGNEFQGSQLKATFIAPHYHDASGSDVFIDDFNGKLQATLLRLPNDNYMPPADTRMPVRTAGAIFPLSQTPLPISLSGTVFEDLNANNLRDSGDLGLVGVQLELLRLEGQQYVPIGRTTWTGMDGSYRFADLMPGTYRVAETQPDGYQSVGAAAGTVAGQTRGLVTDADTLSEIALLGGDDSVHNDFAEVQLSCISGWVIADENPNGQLDPDDQFIPNVTLRLKDAAGNVVAQATTDSSGYYRFCQLMPGVYAVEETQPAGYLDGNEQVGTAGGTLQPPDTIAAISIVSGTDATDYDFFEVRPVSVGGRVYVDMNASGAYDPGESLLAGVTIHLVNASGTRVGTTTTNAQGKYQFGGLRPGTYAVEEVQPAGYLDGEETVGTAGGILAANDRIAGIKLPPGTHATGYDFGELVPASISGYVFQDGPAIEHRKGDPPPDVAAVRDGKLTPDDTRLAGVKLTLADAGGTPILDAQGRPIVAYTNAQGYYEFTGLGPGIYTIIETQPAGYVDGIDTAGTNGGTAVNENEPLDPMILAQLEFDPHDDAILWIPIRPGDKGTGYNFSEVLVNEIDVPPPPVPPPPEPPPPEPPEPPQPPSPFYAPPPEIVIYAAGHYTSDILSYGVSAAGGLVEFTWHLSVIDAGQPRAQQEGGTLAADERGAPFYSISWSPGELGDGSFLLADAAGNPYKTCVFGMRGAIPVVGDWNGDGTTKVGVYREGTWMLDLDGNGRWEEQDLWAQLGRPSDRPVVGDWDGDGKSDIGVFGPAWPGDPRAIDHEPGLPDAKNRLASSRASRFKNIPPDADSATLGLRTLKRTALGRFRKDLIDHVFQFGSEGDVPLAGDFNGDGVSSIAVFREGSWYLDLNGDGRWSDGDVHAEYGQKGDVPVVGDWNGDGTSKLGVYRNGTWYLDVNGDRVLDARDKVLRLGQPGDVPVVGDWNGDGIDEIGVYRPGPAGAPRQAADQPMPETAEAEVADTVTSQVK